MEMFCAAKATIITIEAKKRKEQEMKILKNSILEYIFPLIKKAAEDGNSSVGISFYYHFRTELKKSFQLRQNVIYQLQDLGYSVCWYDCSSTMEISWADTLEDDCLDCLTSNM